MAFYIDTIEQVKKAEGGVNEYGQRAIQKNSDGSFMTFEQTESAYFTKLANVANDLITPENPNKNHYYMDIRIVDTTGGVLEKKTLGTKQ